MLHFFSHSMFIQEFFSLCFRCLFFSLLLGDSLGRFSRASCSSLFILVILTGEFNSVVRVLHILFILVILSCVGNSYQPILLFISLYSFRSVEDIPVVSCYQFLQLFRGATSSSSLHTGAISIFLAIFSNGGFFEWAHNPQVLSKDLSWLF